MAHSAVFLTVLLVSTLGYVVTLNEEGTVSPFPGCLSWFDIKEGQTCDAMAHMCQITLKELVHMNGVLEGGDACNNPPVGAHMCCWFDLENNSTLVKHEHGALPPADGEGEPDRKPQTLKEIIALKAIGGVALGKLAGLTGLAGLAGLAGGGAGTFLGGDCFDQNTRLVVNPPQILLNVRFIGSAVACQSRCFITLNCVNFNYDILTNVCTLYSSTVDAQRTLDTRFISGPRSCGVLP